jgi:hypothetical protein
MKKKESERVPYESVQSDEKLTKCQRHMLQYMKNATLYYRFLLCLICSTSFTNYFDMLSKTPLPFLLMPALYQRELYVDHFEKTFVSKVKKPKAKKPQVKKIKVKRIKDDAEMVAVEADAVADAVGNAVEAEVDTVEQLDEEAVFDGVSYAS